MLNRWFTSGFTGVSVAAWKVMSTLSFSGFDFVTGYMMAIAFAIAS
jgi:hypothetical protein